MRHFGNPIGGPAALESDDRPSRGALMPQYSILTPDDPITAEDMDRATIGALLLFAASLCILIGGIYLATCLLLDL